MTREAVPKSKKIGGMERARKAYREIKQILTNEDDPLYLTKDIDFARKYDVSRHTIYKIRDRLKSPARSQRLLKKLRGMDTKKYTIKELSKLLKVKYQNLYKMTLENGIEVKQDTPPIAQLQKYQLSKKKKPRK
jgi:hypothetical protein